MLLGAAVFAQQPAAVVSAIPPVTATLPATSVLITGTVSAASGSAAIGEGSFYFSVFGQSASAGVSNGSATAVLPIPAGIGAGTYGITGEYLGTQNYATGQAISGTLTINPAPSPAPVSSAPSSPASPAAACATFAMFAIGYGLLPPINGQPMQIDPTEVWTSPPSIPIPALGAPCNGQWLFPSVVITNGAGPSGVLYGCFGGLVGKAAIAFQ